MRRNGFVIIAVISMLVVLTVLITAYLALTRVEIASTKSVVDSTTGFYAAEAGLNLRAEAVRGAFANFNAPQGTAPNSVNACVGTNQGSGTFGCVNYSIQGRTISTYIVPTPVPDPPPSVVIPAGETFAGLVAVEYPYTLYSVARSPENKVEAQLSMGLNTRLVPMFQFAAFYAGDLEIGNGPPMVLTGPVHTNSNMYLSSYQTLQIRGPVSAVGDLFHGRKLGDSEFNDACAASGVSIANAANTLVNLTPNITACNSVLASNIAAYGGRVRTGIGAIDIPEPDSLNATAGSTYWDNADVRIALVLPPPPPPTSPPPPPPPVIPSVNNIEVRDRNNLNISTATDLFRGAACPNTLSVTPSTQYPDYTGTRFFNWRERNGASAKSINLLNVNMQALLQCIYSNPTAFKSGGLALDETTNGGLVFYFTVIGPDSNVDATLPGFNGNNYGVRITNGAALRATNAAAPSIKVLTIVTDQAAYVKGDYNCRRSNTGTSCTNGGPEVWRPAAIMSDSLNILSNAWVDTLAAPTQNLGPVASTTTVNSAFLSGVDVTAANQGNGGLQNYPRLHENWGSATLNYRGSFVSLGTPRRVDGPFGFQYTHYSPPTRNYDYETAFNNPVNLPPMTPRAVFLQQQLFVRQFEQATPRSNP